jgi:hypothetical protein
MFLVNDYRSRLSTPLYAEFASQVRTARAEARLSAEVEVKRGEPLNWLMKGPGRHQPDAPGWTSGDGDGVAVVTAVQVNVVYARRDDVQEDNSANAPASVHVSGVGQRRLLPQS